MSFVSMRGTAPSALVVMLSASLFAGRADGGLVASFEVGTGSSISQLQFDFENGNSYLYVVHWEGTTTGRDLLDIVSEAQPGYFVAEIASFSFGDVLFSQKIGADLNAGFGTPPDFYDFWHYWTRESAAATWESSLVGFGDRVMTDGCWDGWVFGNHDAPATVPAAGGMVIFATMLRGSRRRR
jgi:hypothetical protein